MESGQVQNNSVDPLQSLGKRWKKIGIYLLLILVAIVGYMIFQHYLRIIATILLLSIMFTYLLQPIVEWLVRISKIKRLAVARIIATLFIYLVIGFIVYFVSTAIMRTIATNWNDLRLSWGSVPYHVPQGLANIQQWYNGFLSAELRTQIAESVQREVNQIPDKYVPTIFASLFGLAHWAGQWAALMVELVFVPLLAFYFLTDSAKLREQTLFFIPKRHRSSVMRYAGAMDTIFRRYVQSQLILCFIALAVVVLALLIMGIPGALLLGLIAGVSRAVPVVGPIVGGIPAMAAVLLNPHWSAAFWWVLLGFIALHFFENKFIMPRIMGDHLGVHPVIIIISLLLGYEMLGVLGMFLAPPAIAMVRFVLAARRGEESSLAPEQPDLPGMSVE